MVPEEPIVRRDKATWVGPSVTPRPPSDGPGIGPSGTGADQDPARAFTLQPSVAKRRRRSG
jgi:hypothetical protein